MVKKLSMQHDNNQAIAFRNQKDKFLIIRAFFSKMQDYAVRSGLKWLISLSVLDLAALAHNYRCLNLQCIFVQTTDISQSYTAQWNMPMRCSDSALRFKRTNYHTSILYKRTFCQTPRRKRTKFDVDTYARPACGRQEIL